MIDTVEMVRPFYRKITSSYAKKLRVVEKA